MGDGSPRLVKYEEWQLSSGRWYCNDVSDLCSVRGRWYLPARMMKMPLDEFVKMLIEDFEVDPKDIIFHDDGCLRYSWWEQSKARKFKNWINKKSREGKWIL